MFVDKCFLISGVKINENKNNVHIVQEVDIESAAIIMCDHPRLVDDMLEYLSGGGGVFTVLMIYLMEI